MRTHDAREVDAMSRNQSMACGLRRSGLGAVLLVLLASTVAAQEGEPCDTGQGVCCSGSCTTAVCTVDADCDDGDSCTIDSCLSGGTCAASCDNTPDPSCCVPTHNKEKGPRCSDGIDNDCDGLIDGDDPDC